MTQITAVSFDEAWVRSIEADMDGVAVRIIGLDDLLKNKRSTERAKDPADVEELEKVRQ